MSKPMRISVRLHQIEDPALYKELEALSPIARGHRIRALLRAGKNADGVGMVHHAAATAVTQIQPVTKPTAVAEVPAPAPARGIPINMDFSLFPSATMEASNATHN